MPIPVKPSKFICKNCGKVIIIKHSSDFLGHMDFPPLNCPKCKQLADYDRVSASDSEVMIDNILDIFRFKKL